MAYYSGKDLNQMSYDERVELAGMSYPDAVQSTISSSSPSTISSTAPAFPSIASAPPSASKPSASEAGGLFSTIGKGLAAAAPFMPVIGTVGSLLMGGIGMYLQNKYQKEAQEKADKWQALQNALAVQENAKKWKWMEEDRNYQRSLDFQNNLMNLIASNKNFENDLLNTWRKAA